MKWCRWCGVEVEWFVGHVAGGRNAARWLVDRTTRATQCQAHAALLASTVAPFLRALHEEVTIDDVRAELLEIAEL